MQGQLGRDRTLVDRAIQRRDDLWKEAFTDFNLDLPKPHTELVTKQGNRVYVVKWTPELARPEPAAGSCRGSAIRRRRGGAAAHLTEGAVAWGRTAGTRPTTSRTGRGTVNWTRSRGSRGVGGGNDTSD
jgi:hypothetical protein